VTAAIKDQELPAMYLLGEKYIESIEKMSVAPNSKLILLPADLTSAVRGLVGGVKK